MKIIKNNSLIKLNLCICASITSSLMFYTAHSQAQQLLGQSNGSLQLVAYTLQDKISVYKLANMSNLTIEQLNHLNTNMIKGRTTLSKGETIYLPADSEVLGIAQVKNNTIMPTSGKNETNRTNELSQEPALPVENNLKAPIVTSEGYAVTTPPAISESASNPSETSALSDLTGEDIKQELLQQKSTVANKEAPVTVVNNIPASIQETRKEPSITPVALPMPNNSTSQNALANSGLAGNSVTTESSPSSISSSTSINPPSTQPPAAIARADEASQMIDPDNYENNLPNLGSKAGNGSTVSREETALTENETNLSNIVSTQLSGIANQFGNSQISVNVNEDFEYTLSEFKFLTDIIQTNNAIFFTQFGITHQDELDRHNAISHLGLGYRHDLENIRLGVNTFVDTDFKNMSRLSVGGELRTDYLSFSTNYYTPLDGWSTATSDDFFAKKGAKQKPAKGLDIIMKGYLPSYPQIGGGLSFEQYFGNDIALFGTDNIDKDPFAVKASLDYTPVPLITANMSHRIGENNVHDSTFGIDINYRFGLSLEDQINPDLVAQLRELKGSRFDFVDRNYEVVFEYKQQAGGINIFSPRQAFVNQTIPITTEIDESINPQSYTWMVKTPNSTLEYNQKELDLHLSQEGNYQVQLQVKTATNETKISNVINIESTFGQNNDIVLEMVKNDALAVPELTNFSQLNNTQVILNLHSLNSADNHSISLPSIEWKDTTGNLCKNWCDLAQSSEYMKADISPSSSGGWEIKILGSEKLVDSQIEFKATSTVNNNRVSTLSNSSATFF